MNPKLIKPGIDDEQYSDAAPTIGTTKLMQFSTPARNRREIYDLDSAFFADRPNRSIYLRPAFALEYDLEASDVSGAERPMLWVSVQKVAKELHIILPVWRGDQVFWSGKHVASDEGVWRTIREACLREGIHLSEWMDYIFLCRANKQTSKQSNKPKNGLIH